MPRALQSATLSFGLVNIPVKLYTATSSKSVSFHLLHAKDASRIKEALICQAEDKPVSRDELVKGYEVSKGRYIEITNEELKAVEAEANRNIDMLEFVPLNDIDPIYFKKAYYLGPDKGGEKAYDLLALAMQQQGRGAVAKLVQRGKEELVLIRPTDQGRGLWMHVLFYADEVRTFDELVPRKHAAARPKEVDLAKQLIDSLAEDRWDPAKYRDTYRERVQTLIKKKQAGEKIVAPKAKRQAEVVDLMSALKASLGRGAAAKSRPSGKSGHASRRKRRAAAG
jgi:DNA end-binding protein Ku